MWRVALTTDTWRCGTCHVLSGQSMSTRAVRNGAFRWCMILRLSYWHWIRKASIFLRSFFTFNSKTGVALFLASTISIQKMWLRALRRCSLTMSIRVTYAVRLHAYRSKIFADILSSRKRNWRTSKFSWFSVPMTKAQRLPQKRIFMQKKKLR
jgi:hypothetical protein